MSEAKNTMGKKEAFINALSSFIQRYRKILLTLVIIVMACLVGLVIALQIRKSRIEESFIHLEEVQRKFAEWMDVMDEAEETDSSLEEELLRDAEALIAKYGNLHAASRASDIIASVFYRKEDYERAAQTWTTLANNPAAGYLAPFALCSAAAAWEEAGNPEAAEEAFAVVLARFSASFPDMPHVIFSLGRLAEGREAFDEAKSFYDRLIDEYPGSSWTKLAYNRIILLEIQNRI